MAAEMFVLAAENVMQTAERFMQGAENFMQAAENILQGAERFVQNAGNLMKGPGHIDQICGNVNGIIGFLRGLGEVLSLLTDIAREIYCSLCLIAGKIVVVEGASLRVLLVSPEILFCFWNTRQKSSVAVFFLFSAKCLTGRGFRPR